MSEFVMECKNITKSYGRVQALKNITFGLRENEVLGNCRG